MKFIFLYSVLVLTDAHNIMNFGNVTLGLYPSVEQEQMNSRAMQ